MISRGDIAATERAIRPHVRWTPVVGADGAEFGMADFPMKDFGLKPGRLLFKLEFLQHSGSFKARGAFANLLGRTVPAAGVVVTSVVFSCEQEARESAEAPARINRKFFMTGKG